MTESTSSSPCQSVFNDLKPLVTDLESSCYVTKDSYGNNIVSINNVTYYCDTLAQGSNHTTVTMDKTIAYKLVADIGKALTTAKNSSCFKEGGGTYLVEVLDYFYRESSYFLNNGGDMCALSCFRSGFFGFVISLPTICSCCNL